MRGTWHLIGRGRCAMRHAETVTFGGSGLDRAAELRGDAATLDDWIAAGKAETLVSWRGKPEGF